MKKRCSCFICLEEGHGCFRCNPREDIKDWLINNPGWYPTYKTPTDKDYDGSGGPWHRIPRGIEGWWGPERGVWITLCPQCVSILKKERRPPWKSAKTVG